MLVGIRTHAEHGLGQEQNKPPTARRDHTKATDQQSVLLQGRRPKKNLPQDLAACGACPWDRDTGS